MFGALKRGRFRSFASLILVVNVVGELQRKRTLAASRGFLAAARLSCLIKCLLESLLSLRSFHCFVSFKHSAQPSGEILSRCLYITMNKLVSIDLHHSETSRSVCAWRIVRICPATDDSLHSATHFVPPSKLDYPPESKTTNPGLGYKMAAKLCLWLQFAFMLISMYSNLLALNFHDNLWEHFDDELIVGR